MINKLIVLEKIGPVARDNRKAQGLYFKPIDASTESHPSDALSYASLSTPSINALPAIFVDSFENNNDSNNYGYSSNYSAQTQSTFTSEVEDYEENCHFITPASSSNLLSYNSIAPYDFEGSLPEDMNVIYKNKDEEPLLTESKDLFNFPQEMIDCYGQDSKEQVAKNTNNNLKLENKSKLVQDISQNSASISQSPMSLFSKKSKRPSDEQIDSIAQCQLIKR
ncbi:hypothetical protein ACNVED_04160 [Legionella sp. D16C41]|uniref:hypothetical protein n=1 Tax=Legionella sp. D16C41 TaxID=3402688 RepID=UPI003AF7378B